jgi:hypothetical protein
LEFEFNGRFDDFITIANIIDVLIDLAEYKAGENGICNIVAVADKILRSLGRR